MSEEPRDVAPGGYTWLKIDSPNDYDRLTGILDFAFEPDAITSEWKWGDTNLSWVVGAVPVDVETVQFKTQIAVRHLREARPAIGLEAIRGVIAKDSVAKRLRGCDFIFLAADSMRSRLVVNALVHQYLIPAVQMGAKIRSG